MQVRCNTHRLVRKNRTVVLLMGVILSIVAADQPSHAYAGRPAAVKEVRGPIWISVPTSTSSLQSISVAAPGKGNLVVTVTGTVNYEHTQGAAGSYCLQLSTTLGDVGGCIPDEGSDSAIRSYVASNFPSTVPGFGASNQYSIVRTWPATPGTISTFYLNGYAGGFDAIYLFQPAITVLYIPETLQ